MFAGTSTKPTARAASTAANACHQVGRAIPSRLSESRQPRETPRPTPANPSARIGSSTANGVVQLPGPYRLGFSPAPLMNSYDQYATNPTASWIATKTPGSNRLDRGTGPAS